MGRFVDMAQAAIERLELPTAAQLPRLTLTQFATSGLVLRICSDVLECDVLFAADNADVWNPLGLVVYRASELALLLGCDADYLRLLHDVKRRFCAPVEGDD